MTKQEWNAAVADQLNSKQFEEWNGTRAQLSKATRDEIEEMLLKIKTTNTTHLLRIGGQFFGIRREQFGWALIENGASVHVSAYVRRQSSGGSYYRDNGAIYLTVEGAYQECGDDTKTFPEGKKGINLEKVLTFIKEKLERRAARENARIEASLKRSTIETQRDEIAEKLGLHYDYVRGTCGTQSVNLTVNIPIDKYEEVMRMLIETGVIKPS